MLRTNSEVVNDQKFDKYDKKNKHDMKHEIDIQEKMLN